MVNPPNLPFAANLSNPTDVAVHCYCVYGVPWHQCFEAFIPLTSITVSRNHKYQIIDLRKILTKMVKIKQSSSAPSDSVQQIFVNDVVQRMISTIKKLESQQKCALELLLPLLHYHHLWMFCGSQAPDLLNHVTKMMKTNQFRQKDIPRIQSDLQSIQCKVDQFVKNPQKLCQILSFLQLNTCQNEESYWKSYLTEHDQYCSFTEFGQENVNKELPFHLVPSHQEKTQYENDLNSQICFDNLKFCEFGFDDYGNSDSSDSREQNSVNGVNKCSNAIENTNFQDHSYTQNRVNTRSSLRNKISSKLNASSNQVAKKKKISPAEMHSVPREYFEVWSFSSFR